jgi:hypothetical protein
MSIIDLPPSEYRRVIKGEKPPSRWEWLDPRSWAVIDWVLAVLLLVLFGPLIALGEWEAALSLAFGLGLWIAGMCWRPVGWLLLIVRIWGSDHQ